jgi:hypothetical protein
MLKLLAEINPAQVLPAPGQDTQQSASGNEASSTSMDVDGEADPPAPPAGDGPPAGDAPPARQVVPHNHVGIMSSTADRAALLQEREKQVYEYRRRKTASPAKKESLRNDNTLLNQYVHTIKTFARALVTMQLEGQKDSQDLSCENTMMLISYNNIRPTNPQGGAPRTVQSCTMERPVIRVFGLGKQKIQAVLSMLGKLVSPRLSDEEKPKCDLEWVVQEEGKKYTETVEATVSALKKTRALPARSNMSSNQVQDGISDTGKLCFLLYSFTFTAIILTHYTTDLFITQQTAV